MTTLSLARIGIPSLKEMLARSSEGLTARARNRAPNAKQRIYSKDSIRRFSNLLDDFRIARIAQSYSSLSQRAIEQPSAASPNGETGALLYPDIDLRG